MEKALTIVMILVRYGNDDKDKYLEGIIKLQPEEVSAIYNHCSEEAETYVPAILQDRVHNR